MRYKRVNTLALDVSSTPKQHRVPAVQLFLLSLELDPARLRSVQFHSSGKTIFIGLPDDRSAASIAAKTSRFGFGINGEKHYVPVEFVDEDVTEVRVRDLPPETPTELIQQSLRQYGEVLSVIDEVWRDFFPGIPTGVKIARMKVSQNIPTRITIGSSPAQINYIGQPSRCNKSPPDANCTMKPSVQNPHQQQQQQQQQQQARGTKHKAAEEEQQHRKKTEKAPLTAQTPNLRNEEDMLVDPASPFTVVTRSKAKNRQQAEQKKQQQSTSPNSVPAGPTASDFIEAVKGPLMDWLGDLQQKAAESSSKTNNSDSRLRKT